MFKPIASVLAANIVPHFRRSLSFLSAPFSRSTVCFTVPAHTKHKCRVLIVGAGTGGCSMAWRLSNKFKREIIVLEPSEFHYYQPQFTLIAAGIRSKHGLKRTVPDVLPKGVAWFKDQAKVFDPSNNIVYTGHGGQISYEYLIVALGLRNDYGRIEGLKEALADKTSNVCTIYASDQCGKVWTCLNRVRGGHVAFTLPAREGRCGGSAQKIVYLADEHLRKRNIRSDINLTFNTGADAMFAVPKYAAALLAAAEDKDIAVNYNLELVRITRRGAHFSGNDGQIVVLPFNLLHVTPPMRPPASLAGSPELADEDGFLAVDPLTLQHKKYANVYGIGDCIGTSNGKTAAAVAEQGPVVEANLLSTVRGEVPAARYDGYGACALLTSYQTAILPEYDYQRRPRETFPFDQSKQRKLFAYLTTDVLPYIYWNKLIKGKWNGPNSMRKFINPFGW